MKIKGFDYEDFQSETIVNLWCSIKNKSRIRFAVEKDGEQYNDGCWMIPVVLNDDYKIIHNKFDLIYIAEDNSYVCPFKLNQIEIVKIKRYIKKITKERSL